jgi:AraC-like DNA-binding protein/mannose-6-phosphate isomerase-like protein (cupin superfamily)
MRGYRSLILKKIEAHVPGLHVQRLRLHKHLPEVDALEMHSHPFAQLLCYLSGMGTMLAGGREYPVLPGFVAWVPSGIKHGFRESTGMRPVCLAVDMRLRPQPKLGVAQLNLSESSKIQHHLSELSQLKNPSSIESKLIAASSALSILDVAFRSLGFLPRESPAIPAFIKKFNDLALDPALKGESIAQLATRLGQQPDYLNRRFKQATGVTLHQHRDALRLEQCKNGLLEGRSVGEVGMESGFDDANYFSRWFKRQTGVSPSRFRR